MNKKQSDKKIMDAYGQSYKLLQEAKRHDDIKSQSNIEQAAKEYAEKTYNFIYDKDDYSKAFNMNTSIDSFTAGASFYKNALSQKFEGLREEFFEEFTETTATGINQWKYEDIPSPTRIFDFLKSQI